MIKRNTLQKQLILSTFKEMCTHATAEQVYSEIFEQYKTISLATVYRNLNSLAEDGLLRKIPVSDGADRFDMRLDAHYHTQCRNCGKFEDAPIQFLKELSSRVFMESGFTVEHYEIVFSGLCKTCAAMENTEKLKEQDKNA